MASIKKKKKKHRSGSNMDLQEYIMGASDLIWEVKVLPWEGKQLRSQPCVRSKVREVVVASRLRRRVQEKLNVLVIAFTPWLNSLTFGSILQNRKWALNIIPMSVMGWKVCLAISTPSWRERAQTSLLFIDYSSAGNGLFFLSLYFQKTFLKLFSVTICSNTKVITILAFSE